MKPRESWTDRLRRAASELRCDEDENRFKEVVKHLTRPRDSNGRTKRPLRENQSQQGRRAEDGAEKARRPRSERCFCRAISQFHPAPSGSP